MIVLCCGMPRSGSTLQYQITAAVVERSGVGERIGWTGEVPHAVVSRCERDDSRWFVLKEPLYSPHWGQLVSSGKAKGVYIFRDVRDVVVSHMMKEKKSFYEDVVEHRLVEKTLATHYKWVATRHLLVSRYEAVVKHVAQEVVRIADYLGVGLSEEDVARIANDLSLDGQLRRTTAMSRNMPAARLHDAHTLLHANHIRSGATGQWLYELQPFQVALIENKARRFLVGNHYGISQSLCLRGLASLYCGAARAVAGMARAVRRIVKKIERKTQGMLARMKTSKLSSRTL